MANSVSGTGQGSYEIQEDLQQALHALTDGFILIARDGKIVFMNREAKSILGQNAGSPSITRLEILMGTGGYDWTEVYEAIRGSKTIDHILRGGYRSSVLVSGRRATQPEGAVVLTLRDLEVFDYNRKIASGVVTKNETVSFERRVRPDFARQRQISPYLDKIISRGERALLQGARVIITGESGVGKTEIARHLHHFVANAGDPFVVVNCAAIPESLFESELFGYAKGSFTGALTSGKEGLIERAEGGTLFLDEVGEIPIHLQAKLLSFLEDRFVQRVGGSRPKRVNVRIISATNRDLLQMVQDRTFRNDLYYRLAVIHVPIKPLREISELKPHLIKRFLAAINQKRSEPLVLSDKIHSKLMAYHYPGNIREMHNLLQQISVLTDGDDDIPARLENVSASAVMVEPSAMDQPLEAGIGLKQITADYEYEVIRHAIEKFGSKRKAATALDVDIGTIVRKTKRQENP